MDAQETLARNLAAAVIAHNMGISFASARKNYVSDDQPISKFWTDLAEMLPKMLAESMSGIAFSEQP